MRRTNHRNLVNVGILSGRIPLISLVQFIAVAEHLNFRHAAKALGISHWGRLRYVQSAAKMRIYCHLNGLVMVWLQGSLSSIQHANQKLHQKHNL